MKEYKWATLGCGVIANQLAQALAEMKREHIYLSSKGKEALALWLDA